MRSQIAIIYWVDSAIHGSEQKSREAWKSHKLVNGISVGIVVHEDKEQITIGQDWFYKDNLGSLDEFRNVSSYPKKGITKIRRVILKTR